MARGENRCGAFVRDNRFSSKHSSKRRGAVLAAAVAAALVGTSLSRDASAADVSWEGDTSSLWTVGTNWAGGAVPAAADTAIFGPGAVSFAVDLNGSQTVAGTRFTNATGNYLLSNGTLNVGAVTHAGAGSNNIAAQVVSGGAWSVTGGTLRVSNAELGTANDLTGATINIGAGGNFSPSGGYSAVTPGPTVTPILSNSINNAALTLSGGTFTTQGATGAINTLRGDYFSHNPGPGSAVGPGGNGIASIDTYANFQALKTAMGAPDASQPLIGPFTLTSPPTTSFPAPGTVGNPFVSQGVYVGTNDIFGVWSGTMTIASGQEGLWNFLTASDDGTVLFIDGQKVVDNNVYQGVTTRSGTVNLTVGTHTFEVVGYEGGGGAAYSVAFHRPGEDPLGTPTTLDPTDVTQAGMWSSTYTARTADYSSNSVNVTGDSTIQSTTVSAQFGGLTVGAGRTLSSTGSGAIHFSGTTLPGGAAVTFNAGQGATMHLGALTGGAPTRINKTGAGWVTASDVNTPSSLTDQTTVSVQAGTFAAMGSSGGNTALGGAAGTPGAVIELAGGTFSAHAEAGMTHGLRGMLFVPAPGVGVPLSFMTDPNVLPATQANLPTVFDIADDDAFNEIFETDGSVTNIFTFATLGRMTARVSGDHTFRLRRNDDSATVVVDLNQNGVFDASEVIAAGGCCNSGATGVANLVAGQEYNIAVAVQDTGGGSSIGLEFAEPGQALQSLNFDNYPGMFVSPILSEFGSPTMSDFRNHTINVTADSALDVMAGSALFGVVNLPNGRTLTTKGFGPATIDSLNGSGTVTLNTLVNTFPQQVSNYGVINKTGGAILGLRNVGAPSGLTGTSVINVNAGTLAIERDVVTDPSGGAIINLNNANLLFSSRGGDQTYTNPVNLGTGTSRITAGIIDINSSTGPLTVTTGALQIPGGATVELATNNDYTLSLPGVTFNGNATVNNVSNTRTVRIQNVTLNNNTGTFGGDGTTITGNVSAGSLVTSGTLYFDPGAAGTSTVSANTQMRGSIVGTSGVTNFGSAIIEGAITPGLKGFYYDEAANPIVADFATLDALNAKYGPITPNVVAVTTTGGRVDLGWSNGNGGGGAPFADQGFNDAETLTQIIRGLITIPETGTYIFSTRSDDGSMIYIDGNVVVNNNFYQGMTRRQGAVFLTAGVHEFAGSFYEGGGGAGVEYMWRPPGTAGDAFIPNSVLSLADALAAENGATVSAGGVTNVPVLRLDGTVAAGSTIRLVNPVDSTASVLSVLGDNGGTLDLQGSSRLTVSTVSIGAGTVGLNKVGTGTLRATSGGGITGPLNVNGGRVIINGATTGAGAVTVASGATFGGSNTLAGTLTTVGGARLQPHDDVADAIGTMTVPDLTLGAGNTQLDFNFGTTADMIVAPILTLTGSGVLNVNNVTGFRTGTFTILDYTTESGAGAITLGTTPSAAEFDLTYTIVDNTAETAWQLIIDASDRGWRGHVNNVWDVNTTANWSDGSPNPATFLNLTDAIFDDLGANRDISIVAGGVSPASITVNATVDYSFNDGPINGTGGLAKSGTGTLALNNSGSTFIGPISVTGGTLAFNSVANGGSPSALGSATSPIAVDGATLSYTGAAAGSTDRGITIGANGVTLSSVQPVTFGGDAIGDGDITKVGPGSFSLSSAGNALGGTINVNEGTLAVGSLGASTAALNVGSATPATFSYTGASASNGRPLNIGAGGGTMNVSNAATNLTLTGPATGTTINKTGPGALTLAGQTTLTGSAHTVAEGRINYTNASTATPNSVSGTYAAGTGATVGTVVGGIAPTTVINLSGGTFALMSGGAVSGTTVVNGFGDGSNYTINNLDAGAAAIDNSVDPNGILSITQEVNGQRSTVWHNDAQIVNSGFVAKFTYTRPNPTGANNNPADGISFTLHNDARGLGAIGGGGGAMGLSGITPSASLILNIWSSNTDGLQVSTNGNIPNPYIPPGTINLESGNPIDITVVSVGNKLFYTARDTVTGEEYQRVVENFDIPGIVNGATAIMGFTGATGGANSIQEISQFTYAIDITSAFNNPVNLAAGSSSTVDVDGVGTALLGTMTFQGPNTTLNVTGAGGVRPSSVQMTSGGAYTINTDQFATLDMGHPNTGGIATTLTKTGDGRALITAASSASAVPEFAAGSVLNANGGILGLIGGSGRKNPIGAANVVLNGGEIALASTGGDLSYPNTQFTAVGSILSARSLNSATNTAATITVGSAAKPVTVNGGANLELAARDGYTLNVPNLHYAGDGTVSNTTTDTNVIVGTITSATPATVATLGGTRQTVITGPVTAGTFRITQGGTAGMTPSGAVQNVNAPVLVEGGTFSANSAIVDTGGRVITGRFGDIVNGVLSEGRVNGAFNEAASNPDTRLVRGTPQGNTAPAVNTDPGPTAGWANNTTYIYNGQFFVADADASGSDTIAFGESFDDNVLVKVDGVQRLRDQNWDDSTSSGALVLTPGWHDVEFRFGQGGGGVGANGQGGWNNTFAFGMDINEADGPFDNKTDGPGLGNGAVQAKYTRPEDLPANLFRAIAGAGTGGTVNVAGGAELRSGAIQKVGTLSIGDGGKASIASDSPTSSVGSLVIAGDTDAWTGTLDLRNNDLVIHSTASAKAADHARAANQVKSGLAAASGVFWTGPGINSSTAAANQGGILTAVGIILNDFAQVPGLPSGPIYTDFGGVAVDENDILTKYTWFGDADLTGVVDATDYSLIDNAFNLGLVNGGWLNGDFDFNGLVDATDYSLIDNAFNSQTGTLGGRGSGLAATAAAVPEPTVMGLLAVGALGLLSRRRRRA